MTRPLTLKGAKARAWKAMSRYVIARDKKCITCGSTQNLNAGHFYHGVLDFDETNIHAQCARENLYLSGNLAVYAEFLLKTYGKKEFDKLSARRYLALKGEKRTIEEYLELERHFQEKLKGLES